MRVVLIIKVLFFLSIIAAGSASAEQIPTGIGALINNSLDYLGSAELLAPTEGCGAGDGGIDHDLEPGLWVMTLKLGNDNKFYGIWDYLVVGPENGGDDLGHTHGLELRLDHDFINGIHMAIIHTNDLYTRPIMKDAKLGDDGIWFIPQYATEEKSFRPAMDNRKQGGLVYWRIEGGAHLLDGNPDNNLLLSSGEQQTQFHRAVNFVIPTAKFKDRVQRADGLGLRAGVMVGGRIGVQQGIFRTVGGAAEMDTWIESGATYSTHSGASYLEAQGGIRLRLRGPVVSVIGETQASVEASTRAQVSSHGLTVFPEVDASVGGERVKLGVEWYQIHGKIRNYQKYNTPHVVRKTNDDFANIYIQVAIGD